MGRVVLGRTVEIHPDIFRFEGEKFYGSTVGTYLVNLPEQVVLIDVPAFRPDAVSFVESFKKPVTCIATHGPTVIGDTSRWQREVGVELWLHEADLSDPWRQGTPDRTYNDSELNVGRLRILHTPGHSPGSVCILDEARGVLFSGDTLAGTPDGRVRDFIRDDSHYDNATQCLGSVVELAKESFEVILQFHYLPVMSGARARVKEFLGRYNEK